MILSTHFVTGTAVASLTDSPELLVVSALVLHFLLDMIPHWEYMEELTELKQKKAQLKLALDIIVGPVLILALVLFSYGTDFKKLFWFFLAGTVSVLPDGCSFLYFIFPRNKLLARIYRFHEFVHNKRSVGWKKGIPAQIILNLGAVALLAVFSKIR